MPQLAVTITPGATRADIDELCSNMREADRAECRAGGADPCEAVEKGVRQSTLLWTARVDGELAAIFGVAPVALLSDQGIPWLLGTDVITRHGSAFVRHSRRYIRQMLQTYPRLFNYVHARNTRACRWLRRAGFTLGEPVRAVSTGEIFYPFERHV